MAREATHIEAPLATTWDVLADGWSYSGWVVGSRNVRTVDPGWPQPGSKIHHTVGLGPLSWDDETEVIEAEQPHRLLLEARLRPFATARVQLELEESHGGTRAVMDEVPAAGPLARLHSSVSELLLSGRNMESLRRLRRLAESRPHPGAAGARPSEVVETPG